MIQGIIFDFDGTLYDYESCNSHSLITVFNFINKNFNVEQDIIKYTYNKINKLIKESNNYCNKFNKNIYFKKLLEELNLSIKYLDSIINLYNNEFTKNLKLFDFVIDFIKYVKEKNVKIGILTNNNFKQQYDKLITLGIIEYIDYIQTSDEIGYEKPNSIIFLTLLNKMKINPENIIIIGDNYYHDIIPAIELKFIPFLFKNNNQKIIYLNKYYEFGNFENLLIFYKEYIKSENELVYLAKLFGQSSLNIQGQGGNISVKMLEDKLIIIKSSGGILGNMDNLNGFCIADNINCNKLLVENNSKDLNKTKIFGHKIPSMETFFHCFMKKYTVHIHFTLSNIFLSTNQINLFENIGIKYKIINYFPPGIVLANEIKKVYDDKINLYFLKNHGLIITSNILEEIENLYIQVLNYFNLLLENNYSDELNIFNINKLLYTKFNKSIVCRKYNFNDVDKIINIKYCFPDLAVYIQKIKVIINLSEINDFDNIPDIIIFNNIIYLLADNITKLYCIIETLDMYKILCNNYNNLEIIDNNFIKNMEQEKYRKSN